MGQISVPDVLHKDLGRIISQERPFNTKCDNFLDLELINSMVVASLQDEEVMGVSYPMGTLQLFNRELTDINSYDLARVAAIRKLIGSMVIKCDYYSRTL